MENMRSTPRGPVEVHEVPGAIDKHGVPRMPPLESAELPARLALGAFSVAADDDAVQVRVAAQQLEHLRVRRIASVEAH